MGSIFGARELHEGFNYVVQIIQQDGPPLVAGFSSVSSIEYEISTFEYLEGGASIPIKDPDTVKISPFKLERGASTDLYFYQWLINTVQVVGGVGYGVPIPDKLYKRNVLVKQFNRSKQVVKVFQLVNAFPTNFKAGEWDASKDAVVIESLTLAYDYPSISTR